MDRVRPSLFTVLSMLGFLGAALWCGISGDREGSHFFIISVWLAAIHGRQG